MNELNEKKIRLLILFTLKRDHFHIDKPPVNATAEEIAQVDRLFDLRSTTEAENYKHQTDVLSENLAKIPLAIYKSYEAVFTDILNRCDEVFENTPNTDSE